MLETSYIYFDKVFCSAICKYLNSLTINKIDLPYSKIGKNYFIFPKIISSDCSLEHIQWLCNTLYVNLLYALNSSISVTLKIAWVSSVVSLQREGEIGTESLLAAGPLTKWLQWPKLSSSEAGSQELVPDISLACRAKSFNSP